MGHHLSDCSLLATTSPYSHFMDELNVPSDSGHSITQQRLDFLGMTSTNLWLPSRL